MEELAIYNISPKTSSDEEPVLNRGTHNATSTCTPLSPVEKFNDKTARLMVDYVKRDQSGKFNSGLNKDELLHQLHELSKIASILLAIERLSEDVDGDIWNLAMCAKGICANAVTGLYLLSDNLDEPPKN